MVATEPRPRDIACLDITAARALLSRVDIAAVDGDRRETALHIAVRAGAPDVAELLLTSGAPLEATCTEGFTPVHAAAHAGRVDTLRLLLAARADPRAMTHRGDRPLHLAALSGSEAAIRLLLEAAPALLDERNGAGWSALMLAVYGGGGRTGAVRVLRDHGADDPPPEPPLGWNALLLACSRGDHMTLSILLAPPECSKPQHARQRLEAVGADGHTPLLLAARAGSGLCVHLLLAAGALVDARDQHGRSALDVVVASACAPPQAEHGGRDGPAYEAVVRLLLAAGAPLPSDSAHQIASAPQSIPLRQLISLAALLRRAGCDDNPVPLAHPAPALPLGDGRDGAATVGAASGRMGPAAALAVQARRPALAATLRAPRPAGVTLVVLRQPIDEPAPPTLTVREGSPPLPSAAVEGTVLGAALSRSWRKNKSDSTQRAAQLAEIAAVDAVTLAGGAMAKIRRFTLLTEWSAGGETSATTPEPSVGDVLAAAALAAERQKLAATTGLAEVVAAIAAPAAAQAHGSVAALAGGLLAGAAAVHTLESGPRVLLYQQMGRCDLGAAEIVCLVPQPGGSQVHEQHLALLAASGVCVEAELREAARRPWCVYAEDVRPLPSDMSSLGAATTGVAHLFSLDAPLILSHVIQAEWGVDANSGGAGEGEG